MLAAFVFLVAFNLRPAITAVGPLLPQIGADVGIDEGAQGLLGSLPLLAFAAVSPFVHRISRRLGFEGAILATMLLLAAGTIIRAYTGFTGLWLGTIVVGAAIGIGNVLVPTLVKRDYSQHISRTTGILSAFMTASAALGSAVAVPMSDALGWRGALAFWAVPALVVALVWIPRIRAAASAAPPKPAAHPTVSVWRQPTAWLVTAFMGLQSTVFFILLTWLPTIGTEAGFSAERAGLHLFSLQLAGIAAGLTIPRLMRRPDSQVGAALTASVPILVGALGLLLAPGLSLLWAIIAGAGTGSSLVVALSLISMRGRTQAETTQLSGMAQSMGYLFAAVGPVLAGTLAEGTGGWAATLLLVAGLALVQSLVAIVAGRDRDRHGLTR